LPDINSFMYHSRTFEGANYNLTLHRHRSQPVVAV
jgi:hypothetical protein